MLNYHAFDPETGRANVILSQIVLKEAYDIEYGIYNHDDPNLEHPFQTSLYSEAKTVKQFTPLEALMDTYRHNQIHKYFGLTFYDFLELPADVYDLMIKKTTAWITEERKVMKEDERELSRNMQTLERAVSEVGLQGFDY